MSTPALTRDLVVAQARALKLPGMARVFESLARQGRDAHWPHEDYLHEYSAPRDDYYCREQATDDPSFWMRAATSSIMAYPARGSVAGGRGDFGDCIVSEAQP